MAILYQNINRVLDRLDTLHDEHIRSFDESLMPDLETQSLEREEAIASLGATINTLLENTVSPVSDEAGENLAAIREKVRRILRLNRILSGRVKEHKQGIENSIRKISTGRKVLRSYGSPSMVLNRPKVISVTE